MLIYLNIVQHHPLSVFPGERFNIIVTSSNELGHPAEGVYRIEDEDPHSVSRSTCDDCVTVT